MTTPWSWIERVPTCEPYAFHAALICEDCARKTIERLEALGTEDTGDSDDFPQGPFPENESDTPDHCDHGNDCLNAIVVPGGDRKIGVPLQGTLTSEGCTYVSDKIAENILFGTPFQKSLGRLWLHLYGESLDSTFITLTNEAMPAFVSRALIHLTRDEHADLAPSIYSDLYHLYGGAAASNKTILWRLDITDTGGFTDLCTVDLPLSERHERDLPDMLREAISEDAWE